MPHASQTDFRLAKDDLECMWCYRLYPGPWCWASPLNWAPPWLCLSFVLMRGALAAMKCDTFICLTLGGFTVGNLYLCKKPLPGIHYRLTVILLFSIVQCCETDITCVNCPKFLFLFFVREFHTCICFDQIQPSFLLSSSLLPIPLLFSFTTYVWI